MIKWVLLLFFLLFIPLASASIVQVSPNNFSITTGALQISTVHAFGGGNDYYWMINSSGSPMSYWTKIKVERCKKTGANCDWSTTLEELMTSVQSIRVSDTLLFQNYTTDQNSNLNITFKDVGGKLKLSYDIYGALSSPIEYQVTFETHYIPSQINNNSAQKKVTIGSGYSVTYDYSDELGYPAYSSTDTSGKIYLQWFRTGLGGTVKHIDPLIEGGASGTVSKTCNSATNQSWCNLTNSVYAVSGTANYTGSLGIVPSGSGKGVYQRLNNSGIYIMRFNISNGTGTNNLTDIFCGGYCKPDFSDVEVYMNNTTRAAVWNVTNGIATNYTIEANITMSDAFITVAYNNWSAVPHWNGSATYSVFEDGDENGIVNWFVNAGETLTVDTSVSFHRGKSIKIVEGGAANYIGAWRPFATNCTGKCVFEFSVYNGNTDGTGNSYFLTKTGSVVTDSVDTFFYAGTGGARGIRYYDGSMHNVLYPVSNSQWYQYKIVADTVADTFDFYVDGILRNQSAGTRGTADSINAIEFYTEDASRQAYIDVFRQYPNLVSGNQPNYQLAAFTEAVNAGGTFWIEPEGHPQSELKYCSTSNFCLVNITLTPGTNVKNHQLFFNTSGSYNVVLTYQVSGNSTNETEYYQNGYYYYNSTNSFPENMTSVSLYLPKVNYPFSAQFFGTASLSSNDTNATLVLDNATMFRVNTTWREAGTGKYYNILKAYNNAPTGSMTNASCEVNNPCTVTYTASDNEGNTMNRSIKVNGLQFYGTSPISVPGLSIGNYSAILWLNETDATVSPQNFNYIGWVNITADVTPPSKPTITNGTVATTSFPVNSTNETGTNYFSWEYKANTSSTWIVWTPNTTVNTTTITGLTSGEQYDVRVKVNDTSNNWSPYSDQITVQTLATDPSTALMIAKLNQIIAKQAEQDETIEENAELAGSIGFVGGLVGAVMVISVLYRKRRW